MLVPAMEQHHGATTPLGGGWPIAIKQMLVVVCDEGVFLSNTQRHGHPDVKVKSRCFDPVRKLVRVVAAGRQY